MREQGNEEGVVLSCSSAAVVLGKETSLPEDTLSVRNCYVQDCPMGFLSVSEPVAPVLPPLALSGSASLPFPPHSIPRSLIATGVTALGVLEIEIERKPQRHFQTGFIKLMFKHKGGSTEERKVL